MVSFSELVLNPVAQVKFVHTVASGYVTGAMFIPAISSWYMLERSRLRLCQALLCHRSQLRYMAAILSVIVLGDESGYEWVTCRENQTGGYRSRVETQPAPAAFTLFGFPIRMRRPTTFAIQIPLRAGHHCYPLGG
ncbi:cytochrome ubiquinol oxidase subunit I [Klebsiella pneumoniae subsp. pneumoniae]|nr:cytochrome ubiquinol oxidase subunit I [Klebsiella pneumoniae subsp. pneumoniae]